MRSDYIKREDAMDAVEKHYDDGVGKSVETILIMDEIAIDIENNIPSADVAPVRHGHWIIKCVREYELSYGGTAYVPEYECSCCGFITESYVRLDEPIMPEDADFPKYCEYCGARMEDRENKR